MSTPATPLKVLGICGSLRPESCNMGMLRYARDNAPAGMQIEIADLREVPFFVRNEDKTPAVVSLLKQFETAEAFVFACPEYNYSIAPALKNALDWASRAEDNYMLAGKPGMVFGAGGGMGTSRAQLHLRQVTSALNIHMLNKPEVFANAFGDSFDANGNLVDPKIQGNLVKQLAAFQAWAAQIRRK
ncbi:MAG TPA: NAD(P)H-dependent oxidoreductase [Rhodocyclaceae bacterium]|nr:NAD(P)H-dependent oxidoreductase [Rhodocyclaceae bacterium]